MNTSMNTRAVAFVASILDIFGGSYLIGNYGVSRAPGGLAGVSYTLISNEPRAARLLTLRAVMVATARSELDSNPHRRSNMSTRHIISFHFPSCVAFVVAALANGTVLAQDTAIKVNCGPQLTALQQRLYQKAEEGTDALRQFIFIRRGILQIDTYETAAWANSVNERRAACMRKSAQMEAAPSEAT